GYEVIGLFMRNWDIRDEQGLCSTDPDKEDAQFVCDRLKIPLYEVNFVKEYWNHVFSGFVRDYQRGIIPNPDILCNKYIKFGAFFDYAMEKFQPDAIATGHYARTSFGENLESVDPEKGAKLLKSKDEWKDQTFFLSQISQKALQKSIFPLGDKLKTDVKKYAAEIGLEKIAKKRESMGICFIGKRKFASFIEEYIVPQEGKFVHVETGEVLGHHEGVHHYTYGQNIRIPGMKCRFFVAEMDAKTQTIKAAPGTEHPSLYAETFFTGEPYWINRPPRELLQDQMCDMDFRFQKTCPVTPCTLTLSGGNTLIVSLPEPLRALSPGQFSVFYSGEECLGSARILRIGPSLYTLNYKKYQEEKSDIQGNDDNNSISIDNI
ncbi:hypothetical protein FSP39_011453, partial [Pinctada imbricata]